MPTHSDLEAAIQDTLAHLTGIYKMRDAGDADPHEIADRLEEARLRVEEIMGINDQVAEPFILRSLIHDLTGNVEGIIEDTTRAIEIDGSEVDIARAYIMRGHAHGRKGDNLAAARDYEHATDYTTTDPEIYGTAAQHFYVAEAFGEAFSLVRTALLIDPTIEGYDALALDSALQADLDDEFVSLADEIRERFPEQPVADELAGRFYAVKDQIEKAVPFLVAAVEKGTEKPDVHTVLARYYATEHLDADSSLTHLHQARALGAASHFITANIALLSVDCGYFEDANDAAETLFRVEEFLHVAHYARGAIHAERGRGSQAIEDLKVAHGIISAMPLPISNDDVGLGYRIEKLLEELGSPTRGTYTRQTERRGLLE